MLAIIPDYGDSDSENSDDSETEAKGQDGDDSSHMTSKDCPRLDVCLPLEKKGDLSLSKADSNLKKSPERERRDGQSTSSLPPLKPEQASVIRYLALKRRKDEELKALEEADELERRRENTKRKKKRGQRSGDLRERESSSGSSTDPSDGMKILSSYIGINDHLQGSKVDHGDLAPKSGLEKEIDEAVAAGDVDKAEELSNYLASRNFAVRVSEAANARDYAKRKKVEEDQRLARKRLKKAKLAWGFEVKHRWEMKGNM